MWSIRYKCGGVHCLLFSPILMMGGNSSCNKMLSVWMYADAQCLRHALQARVSPDWTVFSLSSGQLFPHFFFKNFHISLDFLGICFKNISQNFLKFSGQILFQKFSEILQSSSLFHIAYWKIYRGWQPSPIGCWHSMDRQWCPTNGQALFSEICRPSEIFTGKEYSSDQL